MIYELKRIGLLIVCAVGLLVIADLCWDEVVEPANLQMVGK